MAQLHARGELALGVEFVNESFIGTRFVGRLVGETTVGADEAARAAVVPTITGRAWITGTAQFMLDDADPFPEGFLL
jgi:proline racemase